MGFNLGQSLLDFVNQTGFTIITWQQAVMIVVSCLLLYLAIVKQFEPLLLLPIAFGMLLTNLPGAGIYNQILFAGGHVNWSLFGGEPITAEFLQHLQEAGVGAEVLNEVQVGQVISPGLIDYLYLGVKLGIYPPLIFMGVGAMTDFGPLISNPKSLVLGAAAQFGIFIAFILALVLGFNVQEAASIGIIGGADGPTAIYLTSKLAPDLLGPIAVAAYSYMALVPIIQPPIMRAFTSKKDRQIVMKQLRPVSKTEKIIFPIAVTIFVTLMLPSAGVLVGMLMLGNLMRESMVVDRISKTAQNELMNIVTIFLGVSVGATATGSVFLSPRTLYIIVLGLIAFAFGTFGGTMIGNVMCKLSKGKINPLIGSAGVSAVPMAARVAQKVGQEENPKNFLLMHAMGPNVAGVIGSAVAAGLLLSLFG